MPMARSADDQERVRLRPLTHDELDDESRELLKGPAQLPVPASNVFATLVRHRRLFRRWAPFAAKLLNGELSARDREIAILRTAWLCGSQYEWGQHVLLGRHIGLSDEDIDQVRVGPDDVRWGSRDALLVGCVDELHHDSTWSDPTWFGLAAEFTDVQLIELVMLIGNYHSLAFALNAFGIQREPGVPGFDG